MLWSCWSKKNQQKNSTTSSHGFFSVYLSTALMTVFLTTLSNTIGPSFLSCQASIIPWTNSAALILALAIKCAQRYVQGSHCNDKRSFNQLVSGLTKELQYTHFLIIEEQLNRSIKRREVFVGETQSSGSFGLMVKRMAAWSTWHRLVVVIPRRKGKNPYFPPTSGCLLLFSSHQLRAGGNKQGIRTALFFLKILLPLPFWRYCAYR